MGNHHSQDSKSDKETAASNTTELKLIEEQIQELYKFKILLLGTGESGKITVVKQLKLLNNKTFNQDELQRIVTSIHLNIIECIQSLLKAQTSFHQYDLDQEDTKTAETILSWENASKITPEFAKKILRLWKTKAIQKTYERHSEFWILDSFTYCMENLERFATPDWTPTSDDIIMARVRTTGIVDTDISYKVPQIDKKLPNTVHFQVVDVGGQRNERKKWIHCFDDVKAVLYVESLIGFDQVMFEDTKKNRMKESLEVFAQLTKNKIFEDIPVILILNKKDLFQETIQNVDMNKIFPDYNGGKNYDHALEFIIDQFKHQMNPKKSLEVHVISAKDKNDITTTFEGLKNILYEKNKDSIQQKSKVLLEKQETIRSCRVCTPGWK